MPSLLWSQENSNRVELVKCDALDGGTFNNQNIIKLLGNVVFRQGDTYMYCDSAYQYKGSGKLEAFSNVRIEQGDTLRIYGDKMVYESEKRNATLIGHVKLINKTTTLETNRLDYDLNTRTAVYQTKGVITDAGSRLESKKGRYEAQYETMYFRDSVVATDKDSRIETDTMIYLTQIKKVIFVGPTRIFDQDGVLYAEEGYYFLETKVSDFSGRVTLETESYFLSGDRVRYDQLNQLGFAYGNVKMISKSDQLVVHGQEARYNKFTGITKVYGDPWMENFMEKDTFFLASDTMISIDRKADNVRYLTAYYNVRLFKSDMQGKADSITYRFTDSTIHFYRNPILWSSASQLTSDSLYIQMADKKIDKMYMRFNSFIVSEDTLGFYNQLSGRHMIAHFDSGTIHHVDVKGNGESIYHALKDDKELIGINSVVCSDMVILFENNELSTITFIREPEARMIPPQEINEDEDTRLKNFSWKIEERPTREDVVPQSYNQSILEN